MILQHSKALHFTGIRIFGILMNSELIDDLNILLGKRVQDVPGAPRDSIDNPANLKRNIYSKIAHLFNNPNILVTNPSNWAECSEYEGYSEIDGNQKERVKLMRDGTFVSERFKNTLKSYRGAAKKYKSGTGGGSGRDHRFVTWEEREDKEFYGYSRSQGLLLTWIFMHDKARHYILDTQPNKLPEPCRIDGAVSSPSKRSVSSELHAAIQGICTSLHSQKDFQSKLVAAITSEENSSKDNEEGSLQEDMDIIKGLKETSKMMKDLKDDSSVSSEDSTESTVAAREHRREKRKTIQALEKRLMKRARKHTPGVRPRSAQNRTERD